MRSAFVTGAGPGGFGAVPNAASHRDAGVSAAIRIYMRASKLPIILEMDYSDR